MTWIVTADLHLDDNPRHDYRWGIFDFIAKQQCRLGVAGCLILGDITDQKDNHSARLVNRMVDGLCKLRPPVYILKGNHDYIDRNNPFFAFLDCIDGLRFIVDPTEIELGVVAIPHQPNQKAFDEACRPFVEGRYRSILLALLHGLFDGAMAETGQRLTGLRPTVLEKATPKLVLAGDVHAPQDVGIVTYVGAPYRVRFGDDFIPRLLCINDSYDLSDISFPAPRKSTHTIRDPERLLQAGLRRGDQVKITLELAREEAVNWINLKKRVLDVCRELGIECHGVKLKLPEARQVPHRALVRSQSPVQVIEGFCLAENVTPDLKKVGLALLE